MYEIFADGQCTSNTWFDIQPLKQDGSQFTNILYAYMWTTSSGGGYSGDKTGVPCMTAEIVGYKEATIHGSSVNSKRGSHRTFTWHSGTSVLSQWLGMSNLQDASPIYGFKAIAGATMQNMSLTVFGRDIGS